MKQQTTHVTRPARPGKRRILLVANETVKGAALRDVIRLRSTSEPPAEVLVVAPALNSRLRYWLSDEDEARRDAGIRLAISLDQLLAAGIEAEGLVGDADPLLAITDALHEFGAHEIVIATHPEGRARWLTRGLLGRARRRFAQPVAQVVVEPSEGEAHLGRFAASRLMQVDRQLAQTCAAASADNPTPAEDPPRTE